MHPTSGLDDLVHQRVRLGILTVLHEAQRADFTTLADVLGITAGNLSRNLTVLEENGYVLIEKGFEGRRPRTWVQATAEGKAALEREVKALRELLQRMEAPVKSTAGPPRRTGRAPLGVPNL